MYADQMFHRDFKRPVNDRLGARFSRSTAPSLGFQDSIKRSSEMYADQMIPKGIKRPARDLLGASFSRSPAPILALQDPIKRQCQDILNWNNSFHAEKHLVTAGINVHKGLETSDLQKGGLKLSMDKVNCATKIQRKALGIVTNVCPVEPKARPATELTTANKHALQSPSAPKAEKLTLTAFLKKLGLSKYDIAFQAEEVDMIALKHMNDDDLKSIGLPMGPRKKILTSSEVREF